MYTARAKETKIIAPPRLRNGGRVALVAPAGPLLERDDLSRAQEMCRGLGLTPVLSPGVGARYGYLAGTDDQRLEDLNTVFRDETIDAVWCVRGGYGTTRILDRVDFDALARRPRPIIGFSDITALLNAATARTGIITFHGPTARYPLTSFSRRALERLLMHPEAAGQLEPASQPPDVLVPDKNRVVTLQGGVAEGRLVGGNLTMLQCLIGTPFAPHYDGAILFLEDVNEALYRVDRMLAHLRSAGALDRLAGVAVGRFTSMNRQAGDGALGFDEVLATYFEPLGIPVAYGLPIGHVEDQWTMPIGARACLDADNRSLSILDPAVS